MEVLIVEDNEENSLLAQKILSYYGFKTSISLPDIDGMEVTRLLRKKIEYKNIPIIALTAHAMRGIQEIIQEAGLDDFLIKPFLPNDLIGIVRKHLKK